MKTKRLVSLLLVAMLLIGMIPMNALALTADSGVTDSIEVELMLSDEFGSTWTDGEDSVTITPSTYNWSFFNRNTAEEGNSQTNKDLLADGTDILPDNDPETLHDTLSGVFVPKVNKENSDTAFDVAKSVTGSDSVVYLGVKARIKNPTGDYKGIVRYCLWVSFDPTKFEVYSATGATAYNSIAMVNMGYNGNILRKKLMDLTGEQGPAYWGLITMATSQKVIATDDSNVSLLPINLESNGSSGTDYIPSYTTWDVVVPLKVKDTAAVGTSTFDVVATAQPKAGTGQVTPGTVTISKLTPSSAGTDAEERETLVNSSSGASVEYQNGKDKSNRNNIDSNPITVNIVNFSAPPAGSETDYTGSITNRKNSNGTSLYASATDGNAITSKVNGSTSAGPQDTLTFPTAETNFKVGDTVVLYADADCETELGEVLINDDNLMGTNGFKSGEYTYSTSDYEAGTTAGVAGKTLRLVDEEGKPLFTTETEAWIVRKENIADKSVKKSGAVHVTFAAETLYLDTSVTKTPTDVFGSDLGTSSNKVEVALGSTVGDVLDQFNTNATVTGLSDDLGIQNNIEGALDLDNIVVTNATGNTAESVFSTYKYKDGSEYKDGSILIPITSEGYALPTAKSTYNTNKWENATLAPYGVEINVAVVPDPADFVVEAELNTAGTAYTSATLKISDTVAAALTAGEHTFRVRKHTTGGGGNFDYAFEENKTEYTISTTPLPTVGETTDYDVRLMLYGGGTSVLLFDIHVPVTIKGHKEVVESKEIGSEEEPIAIDANATIEGIFNELQTNFRVSGIEDPIDLILDDVKEADLPGLITVTTDDVNWDPQVDETHYAAFNRIENKTGAYKIELKVPATANMKDAPAGTAEGEEDNTYYNTYSRKITVYTEVKPIIKLGTVGTITNNPAGVADTITLTGTENTALNQVVTVYEKGKNAVIATGKVTESDGGPVTITLDEPGFGRAAKEAEIEIASGDPTTLASSKRAEIAIPQETFVYGSTSVYNPASFTLSSTTYDGDASKIFEDAKAGTNILPKTITITYGYSNGAAGGHTMDPATEQTVEVPIDKYTVNGDDYTGTTGEHAGTTAESIKNKTVTATSVSLSSLKIKADGKADITGTTGTPVDMNSNATVTAEFTVDVSSNLYNGPNIGVIATGTKFANNRYPTPDTVTIKLSSAVTKDLTVYYFATTEDASKMQNAVAVAELKIGDGAGDGKVVTLTDELPKDGGSLYLRAVESETDGGETTYTLPNTWVESDSHDVVKFGVEDFTLMSVTVPEDKMTLTIYTGDLSDAEDDADPSDENPMADYVQDRLPTQLNFTAVRFVDNGAGGVTVDFNQQNGTVNISGTDWKMGGAAITDEALAAKIAETSSDTNSNTSLYAPLGDVTFTEAKKPTVSYMVDGQTVKANVIVDLPEAPAGTYNTLAYNDSNTRGVMILTLTQNNENAELKVTLREQDIVISLNDTDDFVTSRTSKNTDDKINFSFELANGYASEEEGHETENVLSGKWYRFTVNAVTIGEKTYSAKTYIGQLPAQDGTGKVALEISKTTTTLKDEYGSKADFMGIPSNEYLSTVTFSFFNSENNAKANEGGSSIDIAVPDISSAVKITEVISPLSISIATNVVKAKSTLTDMISTIKTVSVKVEGETNPVNNVPLKTDTVATSSSAVSAYANGEGNVIWNLYVGTVSGSDVTWSDSAVASNAYATTLGTYNAAKAYKLVAALDTDDEKQVTVGEKVLENTDNLVAEIEIVLYDSKAPETFPLQLSTGNSDLYLATDPNDASDANNDQANAELALRIDADDTGKTTRNTFKNDLIFYYMLDSFDEYVDMADDALLVKPYTEKTAMTGLNDTKNSVTVSGTDLADWLANTDNAGKWSITQLYGDGTKISSKPIQKYDGAGEDNGTTTNIEPRFSEKSAKYMVPQESVTVFDEDYIIRYQVEYKGVLYVFDRNVKLTYEPGDADFTTTITPNDGSDVMYFYNQVFAVNMFMLSEEQQADPELVAKAEALNFRVCNMNGDEVITPDDGSFIMEIYNKLFVNMPKVRW